MKTIRIGFHMICVLVLFAAVIQVARADTSHSAASSDHNAGTTSSSGNIDEVLRAIDTKQATLSAKETELSEREKALQRREQDLDDKIRKLESLRASIRGEMDEQKKNNEERVLKLVSVMETMSPKSASGVLETIDDGLAVEVLKRIETKRMAKILNIMDKNRSAKLSELMTGYYNPSLVGQAGKHGARASRIPAQAGGNESINKSAIPESAATPGQIAPKTGAAPEALDSKKGGTR